MWSCHSKMSVNSDSDVGMVGGDNNNNIQHLYECENLIDNHQAEMNEKKSYLRGLMKKCQEQEQKVQAKEQIHHGLRIELAKKIEEGKSLMQMMSNEKKTQYSLSLELKSVEGIDLE